MAVRDTVRRKLTYEDYLLFPEDGQRHEILDGEHFVTNAPSRWHQRASFRLSYLLGQYLDRDPIGEAYAAPFEVKLSEHDVAHPDLLYVSRDRAGILTDKNVQGAPDLVVEILSDSTRRTDEVIKRAVYERCGVLEYWLVDPQRRTVRVFRLSGGAFVLAKDLSAREGGLLTSPLLPGLEIQVGEIFE